LSYLCLIFQESEDLRLNNLKKLNQETAINRRLRLAHALLWKQTSVENKEEVKEKLDLFDKTEDMRFMLQEEQDLYYPNHPWEEALEQDEQDEPEILFDSISAWEYPKKQRRELASNIASAKARKAWQKFTELCQEYEELMEQKKREKRENTLEFLRSVPLVGMTANGAAIHRDLLADLKSPVLVVEEAGELLEAQVLCCLGPETQQLVMIGDHQQLRPKINNYALEKNHNFAISMFERLLNLKFSYRTLKYQVRMRPEISCLVRPFYKEILDHPLVQKYPNVPGMKNNVFFFSHQVKEDVQGFEHSKKNSYEAKFLGSLANYLMVQGIEPSEITVITPYLGQKHLLRSTEGTKECIVSTIDDYQGDENRIVLLSLVRSNSDDSIGFVKIINRIIVALSRAKHGLYIIGNQNLLSKLSDEWYSVIKQLESTQSSGNTLIVQCPNHPETRTEIREPDDFIKVRHGGCTLTCTYQLECGHICDKLCHPGNHEGLQCMKDCVKILKCGHKCQAKCWKQCPPCRTQIPVELPKCKHKTTIDCCIDVETYFCREPCPKILPCEHPCTLLCGEDCVCKHRFTQKMPCGHVVNFICGDQPKCYFKCGFSFDCGHKCSGDW
jgi:hypothetical protein